jgi:sulfotransferase family protein
VLHASASVQVPSKLPRLRHQRHLRLLPVVYRHTTVSRRDAFLVSYPKSGNTWLRFMLTYLLSGREADFDHDATVVGEVGSHRATPSVLAEGGRLIKSHEPYSGPQRRFYRKAIYLVRDGRDVAVSYYYTLIRRELYAGEFGPFLNLFLGGGVDGYGPWHRHVESWLASPLRQRGSLLVLKYEDLLKEPGQNLSAAMEFLGKPVARGQIDEAVRIHSAEKMRERERQSRFHEEQKRNDIMFVRTAGSGDWARTFAEEDEELFAQVTGDLLPRLGYTEPS